MSENYKLVSPDSGKIETEPISSYALVMSHTESVCDPLREYIIDSSDSSTALWENILNKRCLLQFKEKHTRELFRIIREQDFEYGFDSSADVFVRKLMEQNSVVTKEWLNTVFIEYSHDTKIIIGLLQVISHLEYFEIYPQGPTMALAALAHTDSEVRECGIRAFENWGTIDSIDVLRNVEYPEKWLQEYVAQVISDLEEELGDNVSAY